MTITLKELVNLRDSLKPILAQSGPIKVYDEKESTLIRDLTTDEVVGAHMQFLSLDMAVNRMLAQVSVDVEA